MNQAATRCYVGIGSNLGDAQDNVRRAVARLSELPDTRLVGQSSLYRTAPVDAGGDDFINAVACIETPMTPDELLHALRTIEAEFGRERPFRNAPRTLDLDLLLYGQQTISSESLEVPHPRMTQRAFVLIPLLQVDPFIVIPGQGPAHTFVAAVSGQAIQKI